MAATVSIDVKGGLGTRHRGVGSVWSREGQRGDNRVGGGTTRPARMGEAEGQGGARPCQKGKVVSVIDRRLWQRRQRWGQGQRTPAWDPHRQ